jgi:TIGR03009 family protein
MATAQLDSLLRHIHKLAAGPRNAHATDGQLLDEFASLHDESAFTGLVARHGPMVLRVCRRVLSHEQDAEDAFQATFLVLAKNTTSIRKREALVGWLHGVAYRTAMKAKRSAARRRNHESRLARNPVSPKNRVSDPADPSWKEVRAALDEEIQRLPEHHRSAFVACILEGKSVPQVAAELACKTGTVSSWLARARIRLRLRLAQRGIELCALLAALAIAESAGAGMAARLAQETVRFGLLVAAGNSAAGVIPTHIAALSAGVTRAMFMTKAKITIAILLTLSLVGVGTQSASLGIWTQESGEEVMQQNARVPWGAQSQESQAPARSKAPPKKEPEPSVALDTDDPLDLALLRWRKAIDRIETVSCKVSMIYTNNTMKVKDVYMGTFTYVKPKQWVLELHLKEKPTEIEKWVRNPKSLYRYYSSQKTVIEYDVPEHFLEEPVTNRAERVFQPGFAGRALNAVESRYLLNTKPEETKRRYNLKFTEGKENDPSYIYIDIQPRAHIDKGDFEVARIVLHKITHLPRQYWFRHPNGDETTWDVEKIETGVKLTADDLKPTVPKGWRLQKLRTPQTEKSKEAQDQKDK